MKQMNAAPAVLAARKQVTLELQRLQKSFGSVVAVDEVNLTTKPGEFVTLLGPSGSGKTTTLNLIAGFLTPTRGEILLDGRELSGLPPHKRDIGVVFQNYLLFPHMTAFDNVAFPLRRRRRPADEIRVRVEGALELVGLRGLGHRYPAELSGGQQQRVAVARAIVFGPPLLLMDEPLGALDRNLREDLQNEIKRIHRELGTTFVYVTHDQHEALALSDRIAVFRDGRVEQLGTPTEIYEQPRTVFVARFIGDSNIFHGDLQRTSTGVVLVTPNFTIRLPHTDAAAGPRAVLVRPEKMTLGVAGTGDNAISGILVDKVYFGSINRLSVEVGGHGVVTVNGQAHLTNAWERGSAVTVRWAVEDCVVLADEDKAAG
jgi:putative spermidine/putrescine transport system ATP-binding protein